MQKLLLAITLLALLFVLANEVSSTEYRIRDLGTLPDFSDSSASGVNDRAEVVGWCTGNDGTHRAFYWNEKTGIAELETPDEYNNAYACAINNDGLISGFATGSGGSSLACLWRAGKGLVAVGPKYTDARAVNEMGQSAGGGSSKAAVFSKDMAVKSVADGQACGINNLGEIIGTYFDQVRKCYESFFWSEKTGVVRLGPGTVKDINDSGKIVGYSNGRAVVWDRQGSSQTLPIPSGQQFSSADAVNNLGQVAGSLYGTAVVWQPDNKITELPSIDKDTLSYAKAISESGIVAGEVKDSSGRLRAVVWSLAGPDSEEKGE